MMGPRLLSPLQGDKAELADRLWDTGALNFDEKAVVREITREQEKKLAAGDWPEGTSPVLDIDWNQCFSRDLAQMTPKMLQLAARLMHEFMVERRINPTFIAGAPDAQGAIGAVLADQTNKFFLPAADGCLIQDMVFPGNTVLFVETWWHPFQPITCGRDGLPVDVYHHFVLTGVPTTKPPGQTIQVHEVVTCQELWQHYYSATGRIRGATV